MTPEAFERHIRDEVRRFAFIRDVVTLDQTTNTVKLRLFITNDCFIQVYANLRKGLLSYALVFISSASTEETTMARVGIATSTLIQKAMISVLKVPGLFRWPSSSMRCSGF